MQVVVKSADSLGQLAVMNVSHNFKGPNESLVTKEVTRTTIQIKRQLNGLE